MDTRAAAKLRLRLPSGAELEVEGDSAFVKTEREIFLGALERCAATGTSPAIQGEPEPGYKAPEWDQIVEHKGPALQLRSKLRSERTERDACLILLAASGKFLNTAKPTAAQMARWLRVSGYPVQRVDRALSQALVAGEVLASGSRRARRYELTAPGRAKAFLLANELSRQVAGAPNN